MRVLHVACMPFPSPQGTQAALRSMLEAEVTVGHEVHVLAYGFGTGEPAGNATVHRIPDPRPVRPPASLRSGPSLTKVALDLRILAACQQVADDLSPNLVVAHHVEAALAVGAARLRAPTCFLAHAVLGTELEMYFPPAIAPLARRLGRSLDRRALDATPCALAVAPSVADALTATSQRQVGAIAVPWSPMAAREERGAARAHLGIPADARVVLYAGNLDRYQRWELAVQALAEPALRADRWRLLVATESAPGDLFRIARLLGVEEHVCVAPLANEVDRERAHGAADVTLVPRGPTPGLPVKLLDALARGTPVVATRRATAGLRLVDAAVIVPDDDPSAAAIAIVGHGDDPATLARRISAGRDYLRREHGPERYVRALEAVRWRHIA